MAAHRPRADARFGDDRTRLPALPRHRRRVREAADRRGERPRRRHRHDDAAALRPRAHPDDRQLRARRSCRSASSPKRPGSLLDAASDGQPARRRSSSTPASGSPREEAVAADLALTRGRPRRARDGDDGPRRAASPSMPVAVARRDQAARPRRPHRRDPRRARPRRRRVRPHDRRPANLEALTAFLEKREPDFSKRLTGTVACTFMTIAAQTRERQGRGLEHDGVARLPRHPVRGAARRPRRWMAPEREDDVGRRARRDRSSRAQSAQAEFAIDDDARAAPARRTARTASTSTCGRPRATTRRDR